MICSISTHGSERPGNVSIRAILPIAGLSTWSKCRSKIHVKGAGKRDPAIASRCSTVAGVETGEGAREEICAHKAAFEARCLTAKRYGRVTFMPLFLLRFLILGLLSSPSLSSSNTSTSFNGGLAASMWRGRAQSSMLPW